MSVSSPGTVEDPATWLLDRVIYEFCHTDQPAWYRDGPQPPMPNLTTFEQALRDNDTDGDTLLSIEDAVLKQDYGIKSFGQRRSIMKAVDYLRGMSQRYQQNNVYRPILSHLRNDSIMMHGLSNTNLAQTPGLRLHPSVEPSSGANYVGSTNRPHEPGPFIPKAITRPVELPSIKQNHKDIQNLPPPNTPAKTSLDAVPSFDATHPQVASELRFNGPTTEHIGDRAAAEDNPLTALHMSLEGRKRKRLAPTLMSDVPVKRRHAHNSVKPYPVGRCSINANLPCFYLAEHAQSLPDVFYPTTVDTRMGYSVIGSTQPAGMRIHIARLMKQFLRQQTQSLRQSRIRVKVPYNPSLGASGKTSHLFTMFTPGVEPTVQELDDWMVSTNTISVPGRRNRTLNFLELDYGDMEAANTYSVNLFDVSEHSRVSEDEFNSYLLEKYPALEEDEDVLPPYGESGDEGEYDQETWKDIQDEFEEKRLANSTRVLSTIEVDQAVDEAIINIQSLWMEKKFPKAQFKGYRLWMKAEKEGNRSKIRQINLCSSAHNQRYLQKMREVIKKDMWYKVGDVTYQCKSLEETIFQLEESKYFDKVLQNSQPPSRPSRKLLRRRSPLPELPDGEEVLESDTDASLQEYLDGSTDVQFIPHGGLMEFDTIMDEPDTDHIPANPPDTGDRATSKPVSEDLAMSGAIFEEEEPAGQISGLGEGLIYQRVTSISEAESDMIMSPADKKQRSQFRRSQAKMSDFSSYLSDENLQDVHSVVQISNLDAPLPPPKSRLLAMGISNAKPIDLTLSSEDTSPVMIDSDGNSTDFDVKTPPLNPTTGRTKLNLKLKISNTPTGQSSESTPTNATPSRRLFSLSQPALPYSKEYFRKISSTAGEDIGVSGDFRRGELAKAVHATIGYFGIRASRYGKFLQGLTEEKFHNILIETIGKLHTPSKRLESVQRNQESKAWNIGLFFGCYVHSQNMMDASEWSDADRRDAFTKITSHERKFRVCLHQILDALAAMRKTSRLGNRHSDEMDNSSSVRVDDSTTKIDFTRDSDDQVPLTQVVGEQSARKKRKRVVEQSQDVISQQRSDQLRVQELERRKAAMGLKLLELDETGDGRTHAITFTEPIIYLDPYIGKRVKPHQVDGIQFMWRELITDPKHQGCLLAHTMGLGKTMQVISLLVTIAQTTQSPELCTQLPQSMQITRALILCPPSVIDNWYDEILMWIPQPKVLGHLRKVTSTLSMPERIREIHAWSSGSGVLILSYDLFRGLIGNEKKKLAEAEAVAVRKDLLNGPSIIVADEAHMMKNASSKLSKFAAEFKSRSRIALTGSPLSNHLEEYHAMVNWIAPGYLGTLVQFRAKYSEPIKDGLFSDSTSHERRLSLRKLHVLKKDLDPKIRRADITAIADDLPPKTEFFITLPLTTLQKKAYNIYVKHILDVSGAATNRSSTNARLWDWLAVLSLLCNHPSCFVNKLEDRKHGTMNKIEELKSRLAIDAEISDDNTLPDDIDSANLGLSLQVMEKAIKVFSKQDDDGSLDNIDLCHRSSVVAQILEQSKAAGDKVLIFSHSIPTLGYLQQLVSSFNLSFSVIDGATKMNERQEKTRLFNTTNHVDVFLISMKAGGLGLNIQGANRVIIYDFSWNPTWEEQAVGRAYRLGQTKPVFVYRFRSGGTFEEVIYNKSLFKTQLFARVVDKKNPLRHSSKTVTDYLFPVRDLEQQDVSECIGKDPDVLDRILRGQNSIINVQLTETFQKEDDESMTPADVKQAEEEYEDQVLERSDPAAFRLKVAQRQEAQRKTILASAASSYQSGPQTGVMTTSVLQSTPVYQGAHSGPPSSGVQQTSYFSSYSGLNLSVPPPSNNPSQPQIIPPPQWRIPDALRSNHLVSNVGSFTLPEVIVGDTQHQTNGITSLCKPGAQGPSGRASSEVYSMPQIGGVTDTLEPEEYSLDNLLGRCSPK